MRVVVIGGTGHIGTFLIPRLVRAGHEVVSLSRGTRPPYVPAPEWSAVRQVVADREAADRDGTFGDIVLAHTPDAVIDLLAFTPDSARSLVEALRGRVGHLVHCGTLWRYGPSDRVPIREGQGTPPFDEYGILKAEIAEMLAAETAAGGLVTTTVDPGHIVGPGWTPVGPLGNGDPRVWSDLSAGRTLRVPGSDGALMHHVHADDVAQVFELALAHRDAAAGEDFHAVAPSALTVRGYAAAAASWFGKPPSLECITWEQFRAETTARFANASWGHLHRNHYLSIDKARDVLGYRPRYEPDEAILESVRWLIENDRMDVAGPLVR
ncbi:NAD-dependent epimerase/dehydratase family protein [Microbacterium kunmingense]|uniref:NAD-dependent epimerase/dehydratase family protein n=1 Tax=Microbacterium kunmingense TaxID=2915939 RepID=UPI003D744465